MTLPGLVAANNLSDVVDRERAWDNLGSSVSANFPIPSPSLDLNFAANKNLVDDISGNNLITFSRASTGTFVGSNGLIQTAASGVPRFDHNPATGESLGLLVEEARTNLLLNSATLGTQSVTVTAVSTTLSFYGTGTVTLTGVSTAGPLVGTGVNNRVSLTFTPTSGSLTLTVSGSVINAQLEAGSFPTSYIPTIASTVTRAADVASITGANFSSWYNATTGTLLGSGTPSSASVANQFIACLSDNTDSNFIGIARSYTNNVTDAGFGVCASGPLQAGLSVAAGSWTASQKRSLIGAYAANDFAFSFNGGTVGTDLSGSIPTVTQLRIGGATGPSPSPFNGTIARLAYYPARLPNSALQYITSASGSPSSTTYPYTFTIKGKDTLALNECKNASVRDFVFIKGLSAPAQPRLTTAAQQVASGTAFQDAAMLKASPTTIGNYFFSSGVTLSGVSTRINNTPALSIATSPFSGSTATASILLRELQPQANWRITEPMPSGTIASPEFAIPFETNDFLLFMKAGQN